MIVCLWEVRTYRSKHSCYLSSDDEDEERNIRNTHESVHGTHNRFTKYVRQYQCNLPEEKDPKTLVLVRLCPPFKHVKRDLEIMKKSVTLLYQT